MIPLFRNSIATNNNVSSFDPYFGGAGFFDFDAKRNAQFTLRNASGIDYVEQYICPVSGLVVEQSVASRQPIKQADTCIFDATDDFLFTNNFSTTEIREAWIVATYTLSLAKEYDAVFSLQYGSNFLVDLKLFYLEGGTQIISNTSSVSPFNILPFNVRVNNISTDVFLPATSKKSASGEYVSYTPSTNIKNFWVGQDRGVGYRTWAGGIERIILYDRVLTATEKNDLQAYLQAYHNF